MFLRYVGPPGLYYPTIPLEPEYGQAYDLDDPGDGNWEHLGDNPPAENAAERAPETSLSVNVHPDEEH